METNNGKSIDSSICGTTDFRANTSPNLLEREILNLQLRYAIVNNNNLEVEKLLAQGAYVDITNDYGLKGFIYAIKTGQTELVKALIKNGTNPKKTNENRLMATLVGESRKEHLKIIKILLDSGFNANTQDSNGMTALMIAAYADNDKLVKVFLDSGADVNVQSDKGKTALMFAVVNGRGLRTDAILQMLLAAGADVNSRDDDGKTALIHAIESGSECWRDGKNMLKEMVRILLEAGADVTAKDKDSKTALMYAIDKNRSEMEEILKEAEKI
jgi:ankyrin repeat protein